MSSVPHECPPGGRRCFDCNPRLGTEHVGELPAWATRRHGSEHSSKLEEVTLRLVNTLVAAGVDRAVARREAPHVLAAVIAATDTEGTAAEALDTFVDHYQRASR